VAKKLKNKESNVEFTAQSDENLNQKELDKKKKKERKLAYKKLKSHFSNRFRGAIEKLYAGNFDYEELELFCNYEPTVSTTIESLKKIQQEKQKAEVYNAIINRKEHLIELHLKQTQNEYKKVLEEEERLAQRRAYTSNEIDYKITKLEKIRKRKEQTEYILSDLFSIKEELMPKKKRGRPKKIDKAKNSLINNEQ
jgi:hypothetical protein